MRYGVTMFATDVAMPADELAVEAEARGFDSLYLPEHTHIPLSRRTPPPTGDAELKEEYKRTVDPLVVLAAAAIGVTYGAMAGYAGGLTDNILMRLTDLMLAFPLIVLALAIAAVLGPSLRNAAIAAIIVTWAEYARITRGQILSIKNQEYVGAANAIGVPGPRVMWRHILPNAQAPLLVKVTTDIGAVILLIAGLSFLGLGDPPPSPEWGAMIALARPKFSAAWWTGTFPGLAILTVVMAFNFLGDGLRDAFDPRGQSH